MTRDEFHCRFRWLLHQEMTALRELLDASDRESFEAVYDLIVDLVHGREAQAAQAGSPASMHRVKYWTRLAVEQILRSRRADGSPEVPVREAAEGSSYEHGEGTPSGDEGKQA